MAVGAPNVATSSIRGSDGKWAPKPNFAAMSDEKLFDAFPALDAAAWETIITKELKGADPATLNVRLGEGIAVAPFHVSDGTSTSAGFRRGTKRSGAHGVSPYR